MTSGLTAVSSCKEKKITILNIEGINSFDKAISFSSEISEVNIAEGSQAFLLCTTLNQEKFTVTIGAQANVVVCLLHHAGARNITIFVGENSHLKWIEFAVHNSITVKHQVSLGAEAQLEVWQGFKGKDNHEIDLQSTIHHQGSGSTSRYISKGILDGESKSKSYAAIAVHPGAKGCQGLQRTDIILLSEKSQCDALPVLEVQDNEVACSHSTTISSLSPEQLLYLQSRGIPFSQAKQMITEGFLSLVIGAIPIAVVQEEVRQKIIS